MNQDDFNQWEKKIDASTEKIEILELPGIF